MSFNIVGLRAEAKQHKEPQLSEYATFNQISKFCFAEVTSTVDFFVNRNLKDVVTPIKVGVYEKLLVQHGYDAEEIKYLV